MSDPEEETWKPSQDLLAFLQRDAQELAQLDSRCAQARCRAVTAAVAAQRYQDAPRLAALLTDDAPIVGDRELSEVRNHALAALQELYWPTSSMPELGPLQLRAAWPLTELWRTYREAISQGPAERVAQATDRATRYLDEHVQPPGSQREAALAYCVLRELGLLSYQTQELDPETRLTPLQHELYQRQVEQVPGPPGQPRLRIALRHRPADTLGWVFREAAGPWQTRFSDHPATPSALEFLASVRTLTPAGVPRVEHDAHGAPRRSPDGSFVVGPALDEHRADPLTYLRSVAAFLSSHYTAELVT